MPLKIVCIDCQSDDVMLVHSGVEVPIPGLDKKVPAEHLRCLTCSAEWFQFALREAK
jgi:hypothetical protein